jgi:hypothetical protein
MAETGVLQRTNDPSKRFERLPHQRGAAHCLPRHSRGPEQDGIQRRWPAARAHQVPSCGARQAGQHFMYRLIHRRLNRKSSAYSQSVGKTHLLARGFFTPHAGPWARQVADARSGSPSWYGRGILAKLATIGVDMDPGRVTSDLSEPGGVLKRAVLHVPAAMQPVNVYHSSS